MQELSLFVPGLCFYIGKRLKKQKQEDNEDYTNLVRIWQQTLGLKFEILVLAMVYFKRIQNLDLNLTTKQILLGVVIVADKNWVDESLYNIEFWRSFRYSLRETNEIERTILGALDYQLHVEYSEYLKVYNELTS